MDDTNWAPVPGDAVLSSFSSDRVPYNQEAITAENFQRLASDKLIQRIGPDSVKCLSGFGCRMLKPGGDWQPVKVRVKITVELVYTDH